MDDEGFDFEADCECEPAPWRWGILAAAAFSVLRGTAESVANGLRTVEGYIYDDLNYRYQRDQFHQQAAIELETILEESDG